MAKEKIDYLGIRRVFERDNNQRGLDRFTEIYCELTFDDEPNKCDPILEGITVSASAIKEISNNGLLALIISDAKPHDELIAQSLSNANRIDNAFYLLFRNLITIHAFKNAINPSKNYKPICRIISNIDLSLFDGLDMESLERDLLCNWNPKVCEQSRINAALLFLKRIPYNDYHCSLAIRICDTLRQAENAHERELSMKDLMHFINKQIPSSLRGNELVELLASRPDYCCLLTNLPDEIPFKSVFYESTENDYDSMITELTSLICQGKLSRISFTIDFFKELLDNRVTILNYWAANDMALELDIYGPDLMRGKCPNLELDDAYIKEKEKKGIIGEDKSHTLNQNNQ